MQETMIQFDHVTKEYRLGAIGGGTLRGDLQSLMARIRGKEDPNLQIGQSVYAKNQRFLALDDVSFSVKKGERVGIIGHNGAGKSTLLKLLSRVTGPTSGTISYNGRIASMLEVGTGFHPELTGRENVYMNGAILGMTKAEIREKFDDIVRFAEMEQFIDTPVKRYSSGMYVKLAFAVAAHLDSDILVMDEVLAVGDMKFQQKCLGKMDDVSKNEGRTVLYVSHNMNTIRQLCTRCVVLDHGKVVFDGDTEQGIGVYMDRQNNPEMIECDLSQMRMPHLSSVILAKMVHFRLIGKKNTLFQSGETVRFQLSIHSNISMKNMLFRFELRYIDDTPIGTAQCPSLGDFGANQDRVFEMAFQTEMLTRGKYKCLFVLYGMNEYGTYEDYDAVWPAFIFEIEDKNQIRWNESMWGHIQFPDIALGIDGKEGGS